MFGIDIVGGFRTEGKEGKLLGMEVEAFCCACAVGSVEEVGKNEGPIVVVVLSEAVFETTVVIRSRGMSE